LPLDPPAEVKHWHPTREAAPDYVTTVVRYGQGPEIRRAERIPGSTAWIERGAMVNFYADRTPPMRWSEVGVCWAWTPHPVVEVTYETSADGLVTSELRRRPAPGGVDAPGESDELGI